MRWKPSRKAAREFAATMREINAYCTEHGIEQSRNGDSYYFEIEGRKYRVSNHTVEASNRAAVNCFGERIRDSYHLEGRQAAVVYIHASKTRIREIYNDLAAGYELDGRGNRRT